MFALVWLVLLQFSKCQQETNYTEYVYIPKESFIHLSQSYVPDESYFFNPGTFNASMDILYLVDNPSPLTSFNLYIFPNSSDTAYPCVINKLLLKKPADSCVTSQPCDNTSYSLSFAENATQLQNCILNQTLNYTFGIKNQPLDKQEYYAYILVLENLSNEAVFGKHNPGSFALVQRIIITPSDQYYEIALGLCIGLGIMVILLTSVLCIFNYKYQKVKEQNITMHLVRGESNQTKNKSELKNK